MPQNELLQYLEDEIDLNGLIAFQNAVGFLELVAFYFNSGKVELTSRRMAVALVHALHPF